MTRQRIIAVIGPGDADAELRRIAHEAGAEIACAGFVLITGGLGGVMEAASRGAQEAGGTVVAILPGESPDDGNPHAQIAIATGCGQGRNVMIVNSADALIAIGGGFGTLSEIALALRAKKPIAAIGAWPGLDPALPQFETAPQAIAFVISALQKDDTAGKRR